MHDHEGPQFGAYSPTWKPKLLELPPKNMVKIVLRKADGSEVEAEVPVLNAGVIRLDGELYSLDRMTTDRAMSSGKRTAYFVPAEILDL